MNDLVDLASEKKKSTSKLKFSFQYDKSIKTNFLQFQNVMKSWILESSRRLNLPLLPIIKDVKSRPRLSNIAIGNFCMIDNQKSTKKKLYTRHVSRKDRSTLNWQVGISEFYYFMTGKSKCDFQNLKMLLMRSLFLDF